MLPVIAIVGRPNVGKSTLFNRITRSRDAVVADMPGVTRDRQYGRGKIDTQEFIIVDTGGIGESLESDVDALMEGQTRLAIEEADVIFFMVDARSGLTPADEMLMQEMREIKKPVFLLVNKTDGMDPDVGMAEFYQLGCSEVLALSAEHGRGMRELNAKLSKVLPPVEASTKNMKGIKVAIVGRPNVGKSTLVNRILGEERVVVFDAPGTTRDSIYVPFKRDDRDYTLIDTAGVRRRRGINEAAEKFSVIKAFQAIEDANAVVFVLDAQEKVAQQDMRLLSFVIEAGKALVVVVNKWDNLPEDQKEYIKKELDRKLGFLKFARTHFISALHGTGVGKIYDSINEAYKASMKELSTSDLTEVLEAAIVQHQPPLVKGRRVRLKYAHAGGKNPPVIVLHGNQCKALPESYQRYLIGVFRKKFNLVGTPVRLELKSPKNPYDKKI